MTYLCTSASRKCWGPSEDLEIKLHLSDILPPTISSCSNLTSRHKFYPQKTDTAHIYVWTNQIVRNRIAANCARAVNSSTHFKSLKYMNFKTEFKSHTYRKQSGVGFEFFKNRYGNDNSKA